MIATCPAWLLMHCNTIAEAKGHAAQHCCPAISHRMFCIKCKQDWCFDLLWRRVLHEAILAYSSVMALHALHHNKQDCCLLIALALNMTGFGVASRDLRHYRGAVQAARTPVSWPDMPDDGTLHPKGIIHMPYNVFCSMLSSSSCWVSACCLRSSFLHPVSTHLLSAHITQKHSLLTHDRLMHDRQPNAVG